METFDVVAHVLTGVGSLFASVLLFRHKLAKSESEAQQAKESVLKTKKQIQLTKTQVEQAKSSVEQMRDELLGKQAALQIALSAQPVVVAGASHLSVVATLENRGQRNLAVVFKPAAFAIRDASKPEAPAHLGGPIRIDETGKTIEMVGERETRFFRVGQVRSVAFFSPPLAPGAYFVQFRAGYVEREHDLDAKDDAFVVSAIEQMVAVVPPPA